MLEICDIAKEDLPAIHALAEEWLLKNASDPEESGFLVSNFTIEQYQKYLDTAEYFFMAKIDDEIAGFVLAYSKDSISPDEVLNSILKNIVVEDFILIKQICISKKHPIAAVPLYEHLFAKQKKSLFFTAIVDDPLNIRSINFHKKMGFTFFENIMPPPDYDGEDRIRSVWIRKGNKGKEEPTLRIAIQNSNDKIQNLLVKQSFSNDLYQHEDNLNWTKLGMLVSFMMALITGSAFIIREPLDLINGVISLLLITIGYMIVFLFKAKIKSGIIFMQKHKSKLVNFDKIIMQNDPSLTSTLDKYTKQRSKTVKLIDMIPEICFIIWSILSIIMLARYLALLF